LVEGLLLSEYSFDKYKSKKSKFSCEILIDINESSKTIEQLFLELEQTKTICKSVNLTRDIVNTTP
jgi:leucyl aminopeptidase